MTLPAAPADPDFGHVYRFIITLGEAAHGYGSTASRLEEFLSRLTETFGYSGVFRSTPTEIVFAIQQGPGQPQRVHMSTFAGAGLDLAKLALLGELVDAVIARDISVPDATDRLAAIAATPPPWGRLACGMGYALVGAGLAVLFAGGWWDVAIAPALGALVYLIVLGAERIGPLAGVWLPLFSAFVAAGLATFARVLIPDLNVVLVTLAAIAVLLPGYTISLGLIELVAQRVTSGTSNLVGGLVYLAKQIAGTWLGMGLAGAALAAPVVAEATPVDPQWLWLFMPLLIVALCVVFQTARRDMLSACTGCAVAYGGILLGSAISGSNLGNLVGTIIAVVFANLWAGRTGRPTSIVLLPAVILLVSGSIGFRGALAMADGQSEVGEQQFLQMFIVALTIAVGLLVGNTISRPRVTL